MDKLLAFVRREIEIQDRADGVDLIIGVRTGVVDMFVVGVELDVPRERKQAAGEKAGNAPFGELALVFKLGGNVGARMVRADVTRRSAVMRSRRGFCP
jgi:hypothetical protein